MKTTITIILLLIYSNVQAQTMVVPTTYSIYDTTNGIQNFTPSKVIVPEYNNFQVVSPSSYSIYGIQDITPSQIVVPNTYSGYDTYQVIIPTQIIIPTF